MFRMMMTVGTLCLVMTYEALVVMSHMEELHATVAATKRLAKVAHLDHRASSAMRFALYGRTATWDFTIRCDGVQCRFQVSTATI